jgi:hypothetical protein
MTKEELREAVKKEAGLYNRNVMYINSWSDAQAAMRRNKEIEDSIKKIEGGWEMFQEMEKE